MTLLTEELKNQLPALYSTERSADPVVICKFFSPDSDWTWFVLEFDGEDTLFGLVQGLEEELGYFSLKELESVKGPFGLPLERDLYFTPCLLSQVKSQR